MWHVASDPAWLHWQRQQRRWLELWWTGVRELVALPFEFARHHHAASVRAGVLPCSLLASQRFEQQLGLVESLSLGPLSRRY